MRSSIHCVRMARWTRVVSTLREKLGGNLVDRTSFVRARSSAMEPVPLMVGMVVYLMYAVCAARRLWTVSDLALQYQHMMMCAVFEVSVPHRTAAPWRLHVTYVCSPSVLFVFPFDLPGHRGRTSS